MASFPGLKRLKPFCSFVANKYLLLTSIAMMLAALMLVQVAQGITLVVVEELLSRLRALQPIYLLLAILSIAMGRVYLLCRPKPVYLIDYACFNPSPTYRVPKAMYLEIERLSPFYTDSTIDFIARMIQHPGIGEETCLPPALHYVGRYCCLNEARNEAELVIFSVIDDLLAKTSINLEAIDVLITNCTIFCPVPSMADMIVNRYKLRAGIHVINLSGMGCSAAVTAVGLTRNIMQVMPLGSRALVVSTETLGQNYYVGSNRSMQLTNILFRMGGCAMLLSTCRSMARFQLAHVVRTTTAANDHAYRCVYQEEDDNGNTGVSLSKELMSIAGSTLKDNITIIGPLVLPASELLKFFIFSVAQKVLKGRRMRPYTPDFRMAFEHFCIHVGGPEVINSVQRGLNLSDENVEPSRMTLHRFGNQSSTSVWYEMAYIEAKERMQMGDRVWMLAFGAGYKCNSAVWVCIQPSSRTDGPWASCINRYPVDVSKKRSNLENFYQDRVRSKEHG